MITIGGSRGEKAENKTADVYNIKIGDNNIEGAICSSEDSNKVVTNVDKDEDKITNEEEKGGGVTNTSKEHCRLEQNGNENGNKTEINDEEADGKVTVNKACSNNKSNKQEGDVGSGDDNYNMAGTEQVDVSSVDDGGMYAINNIHTSSNKTQLKGIDKVKRIDDSL